MKLNTYLRRARGLAAAAALATFGLSASACSNDDSSSASSSPATGGESGEGTFPVTIENMFGTTVIESKPERVVSIGYTEGDFVLALGVTPVAIRDWYGDKPGGLWPWAAETAAASDTTVVMQPDSLNFEQIAALDPDVIIAIISEIQQSDYDTLSQIAPVVAQTDDYIQYGTPWDVTQLTIGKALGLLPEAEAIVADVQAQVSAAAAAHPEWSGLTANVIIPSPDGSWYAYTDQDSRGRLLTELGFVIPQPILDLAGDLFYAQGSGEQLALVDADLLLYNTFLASDRDLVDALPLWTSIPAVADGRSLFADEQLIGAMSFATTLSIPYAVKGLVPLIEATLGD